MHGGKEMLFLGDGFMAAFPEIPDAIESAAMIQRELAEQARSDPENLLRVRIGLHAGTVSEPRRGGCSQMPPRSTRR